MPVTFVQKKSANVNKMLIHKYNSHKNVTEIGEMTGIYK